MTPSERRTGVPSSHPGLDPVEDAERPADGGWWEAFGGTRDPVSGVIAFPRGALPSCRVPGCRHCDKRKRAQ